MRPFLFVTIACGALTGLHSIVASGTTSNNFSFKRLYGSGVAAGIALLLALMPGIKQGQSVGQLLWPLFGTTNQLLAALVFATVTVYLVKRKTAHWFISIPLVFVAITTISAMIYNIVKYIQTGNWILTVVGSIILLAAFFLIALSCGSFMRARAQVKAAGEPTEAG